MGTLKDKMAVQKLLEDLIHEHQNLERKKAIQKLLQR